MRTGGPYGGVTTGFAIPPNAPDDVDHAHDKLVALHQRLEALKQEIRDAESKVIQAQADDIVAVADAVAEGKLVDDPNAREQKARRNVEKSRAPQAGIELACDRAGNALLAQIDQHRDEWHATIHPALTSAHSDYLAAIDAAIDAAGRITSGRATLAWLDQFTPDSESQGGITVEPQQYAGAATLKIDTSLIDPNARGHLEPILAAARTLTAEEPPPPAPRSLVAALPDDAPIRVRPRRTPTPVAA